MFDADFIRFLEEDVAVSNSEDIYTQSTIENIKNSKLYIYEAVLDDVEGELNDPQDQQQPQMIPPPLPQQIVLQPGPQDQIPVPQPIQQTTSPQQPDFTGGLGSVQPQDMTQQPPEMMDSAMQQNSDGEQAIDPNTGMPIEPGSEELGDEREGTGTSEVDDGDHSYKPETIGHLFKAKKIYQILVTIKKSLEDVTDKRYSPLKDSCDEGLDIFRNIISNFNKFSKRMPEILKLYKKFSILLVARLHEVSEEINAEQEKEKGE